VGYIGEIVDFRHLSRRISETVQDKVHVAIGHRDMYRGLYALSIGAKIDDF